jgi:N-acetylglucosamine malate deacetylase 1
MNVLAVGANPDDIEILCAGTMAKYVRRGDNISFSFITTGDKGSTGLSKKEMSAIRKKESEKAAAMIGADLYPLGIPDGEVVISLELRKQLVAIIRKVKPDVIITHHPDDYMSDHINTSRLVLDANFWSAVDTFAGNPDKSSAHSRIPPVYFMDTVAGIGCVPEEYVDITDVFDVKVEMLSKHKSQMAYMMERDGLDLLDYMTTAAKYRGYQCGVKYAEGFIRKKVYPSLSPKRLLP